MPLARCQGLLRRRMRQPTPHSKNFINKTNTRVIQRARDKTQKNIILKAQIPNALILISYWNEKVKKPVEVSPMEGEREAIACPYKNLQTQSIH
ncbi:MAG: hypothetical protein [Microvirus sp.]|nr:MAG: hypothetical protein [Microvirus sp.]